MFSSSIDYMTARFSGIPLPCFRRRGSQQRAEHEQQTLTLEELSHFLLVDIVVGIQEDAEYNSCYLHRGDKRSRGSWSLNRKESHLTHGKLPLTNTLNGGLPEIVVFDGRADYCQFTIQKSNQLPSCLRPLRHGVLVDIRRHYNGNNNNNKEREKVTPSGFHCFSSAGLSVQGQYESRTTGWLPGHAT